MSLLLEIEGLCKRYAAPVLVDVDLNLQEGEVHALVGANGAGKTTLTRVVSGLVRPESGRLHLGGKPFSPRTKAEAEEAGVRIVMQELNLIPTLSVAENVFFSRMPRRLGFVDYAALKRQAIEALAKVGLEHLDPSTPVGSLGVGRQQLVEIAAALAWPCRLLILDEPTAALTDPEIEILFDRIHSLKRDGVGVIYISHRMEEIRRIADRVTVLRDGRVVHAGPVLEVTTDELVRKMVGGIAVETLRRGDRDIGSVALRVQGLTASDLVRDVSLEIRHGEILGLAGLVGSGRTELLRAIFGAGRVRSGEIFVGSSAVAIKEPRDAVRSGIGMLPEDRKQHGLLLPQSIRINATLSRLNAFTRRRWWIDRSRERAEVDRLRERLGVDSRSSEQPVVELSGGNQQKVAIGKWLLRDCDILLFDEPTRGVDAGARSIVYGVLGDLAARGKAILVVSSELRELMSLCDRIAVMSAGRIAATFLRNEWTEEKIMAAAFSEYLEGGRS